MGPREVAPAWRQQEASKRRVQAHEKRVTTNGNTPANAQFAMEDSPGYVARSSDSTSFLIPFDLDHLVQR